MLAPLDPVITSLILAVSGYVAIREAVRLVGKLQFWKRDE